MRVKIGKYRDWFGVYQLANILKKVGVSEERCDKIGEWLSKREWLVVFLEWVYSKRKRTVKVKIDYWDTWSMDLTLALIILPMLKQLKATKQGAPMVEDEDLPEELRSANAPPKEPESIADEFFFSRYDWILNEIIWSFEQLNDEDNEDQFFTGVVDFVFVENSETGHSMMEFGENHTSTFDTEGYNEHRDRISNGLRLFGLYFRSMWD